MRLAPPIGPVRLVFLLLECRERILCVLDLVQCARGPGQLQIMPHASQQLLVRPVVPCLRLVGIHDAAANYGDLEVTRGYDRFDIQVAAFFLEEHVVTSGDVDLVSGEHAGVQDNGIAAGTNASARGQGDGSAFHEAFVPARNEHTALGGDADPAARSEDVVLGGYFING